MPSRWTEEEIDLLAKMTADGKSSEEIANKLGRTPSAVKTKQKSLTQAAKVATPEKESSSNADLLSSNDASQTLETESSQPTSSETELSYENENSTMPYIIGAVIIAAIIWWMMGD